MDENEMLSRSEAIVDIWASWALEGMVPTDFDREMAQAYITGDMTLDEIGEAMMERYAVR